ncbi:hypothetical protein PM076_11310 [Halorubrum ezzemoulense]|uniref:Uncharacterized protein n=2 Tax=Halorubrum ezzemoulense TaxID=337243 RepID=A0A256K2P9_HALEZ|nr:MULTISPECIES: hypothetical protein [Halorubrum]MDB2224413.1 hypothetical protein [Halorubrum ezzemoulense]MDB2238343.1 hypothetical protein [Halorubrum ezzemoulense]MDB2239994.1 hypothetical protein [Halorubrum ezzemoulense]MDB2244062.1 hypothetical protein [Halorubrum ezzemoulense]MDB2247812.1 hypothetical protein [Halorubrum ezzemoulense]
MDRSRFVALAFAAFGLVFVSFLIRGTTRLVAPYGVAVAASAPVLFAAAGLLAGLVVLALLDLTGIRPLT